MMQLAVTLLKWSRREGPELFPLQSHPLSLPCSKVNEAIGFLCDRPHRSTSDTTHTRTRRQNRTEGHPTHSALLLRTSVTFPRNLTFPEHMHFPLCSSVGASLQTRHIQPAAQDGCECSPAQRANIRGCFLLPLVFFSSSAIL